MYFGIHRHNRYFDYTGAASIVLMSHLGRPDGHKVEKYSLKPVVRPGVLTFISFFLPRCRYTLFYLFLSRFPLVLID